jgi:hypothetical protein
MSDLAARAAATVRDDERIIAIINVGEPAEIPAAKKRDSAVTRTVWVP